MIDAMTAYDDVPESPTDEILSLFRGDETEVEETVIETTNDVSRVRDSPLLWRKYPVHLLPRVLRDYVSESAKSIGCDPAAVALPLLAGLSACIGNRAIIVLKNDWIEPAVLWAGIVGESGSNKSTAIEMGLRPLKHVARLQRAAHESELARFVMERSAWEARNPKGKPTPDDPPPLEPLLPRCMTSDATIEALVQLLQQNPLGVLMHRDELAGWIKDLEGPYKRGGSDKETWLSMFRAESIEVDRKTTGHSYVSRASVSVCGGIQPGILHRHLTTDNMDSGLIARLLLIHPPEKPKRWTDDTVSDPTRTATENLFLNVNLLGSPTAPQKVKLSRDARRLFVDFVDNHGRESAEHQGSIRSAFSKLEAYCARFALLLHISETVHGASVDPFDDPDQHDWAVTASQMQAAIELVQWHMHETQRVYQSAQQGTDVSDLVHYIATEHGGRITSTTLARSKNKYRKPGAATTDLEKLVQMGLASWEVTETSGRPASVCKLTPVVH